MNEWYAQPLRSAVNDINRVLMQLASKGTSRALARNNILIKSHKDKFRAIHAAAVIQ
jgi:hypothetical protein